MFSEVLFSLCESAVKSTTFSDSSAKFPTLFVRNIPKPDVVLLEATSYLSLIHAVQLPQNRQFVVHCVDPFVNNSELC